MANLLTPAPFVFPQYFDDNGNPAAGALLFTYAAGTTTKQTTYSDAAGTVPQSNPIVLDSDGRPASVIFLSPVTYKFVLAGPDDTDPPGAPLWTADNIQAVPAAAGDVDVSGTAGETLAVNDWVYVSAGDGGRTSGRWYKADADLTYGSIQARTIGVVIAGGATAATITVRVGGRITGLSGLTAGSEYYISATAGAITATLPINFRRVGQADSTTTLVLNTNPPESVRGIYFSRTGTANSGTGETTLNSTTLPANYLDVGRVLRIRAWGTSAANVNAKTVRIKIGTQTLIVANGLTTLNNLPWCAECSIYVTATNTVSMAGRFSFTSVSSPTPSTGSVTLSSSQTISVTGQGGATNDLVDQGLEVELLLPGDY